MGLIAHYRLDGSAEDAVNLRGSTTVGEVVWEPGKVGTCATFSGNGHIDCGEFNVSVYPLSWSAWVKVDTAATMNFAGLANDSSSSQHIGIGVKQSGDHVVARLWNYNGSFSESLGSRQIAVGEWVNVTIVYHSDTLKRFYVDGQLEVEWTAYEPLPSGINRLKIAMLADSTPGGGLVGSISGLRIYDHALSPREVRDLSLGLVLDLRFSQEDDLSDSSGQGVGAQVSTGAPTWEGGKYVFSGVDSFVLPEDDKLDFTDEGFTLCFRAAAYSGVSGNARLFSRGSYGGSGYEVFLDSSTLEFRSYDGGSNSVIASVQDTTELADYVVVKYPGSGATIYRDGNIIADNTTIPSPLPYSSNAKIGRYSSGYYLTGEVHFIKAYATALTPSQVKELYQQRASIDSEGSVHGNLIESNQGSFYFDGSTYIEAPAVPVLSAENNDVLTVAFWIKVDSVGGTTGIINFDTYTGVFIFGGGEISFQSNGDNAGTHSKAKVDDGRWHRVVSTYVEGSKYKCWIDGKVAFEVPTTDTSGVGGITYIGRRRSGGYLVGSLSQISVWDYEPSNDEVDDFFGGLEGTEPGLIAYWPLNQDGGSVATELSNGADGVVTGSAAWSAAPKNWFGVQTSGLVSGGASEVGVTRGLVAWYPLIGDTLDYAGVNHAVNNGAVATAEGYEFDGSSNAIPEDNLTVGGSPGFSVSMVIRVDSLVRDFQMSVHLNEVERHVGTSALWGGVSSGNFLNMTLGAKDASGWAAGETSITPEVGRLYHVCASWDGEITTVYVDGKAEVSYPLAAISEQTGVFRIGGHDGGYRGFNGIIRDVRIHNVALTPEEVAIQAKLALSQNHRTAFTQNCMYTRGQIKEVIA